MDKVVIYEVKNWSNREAVVHDRNGYASFEREACEAAARARMSAAGFAYSYRRLDSILWIYLAITDCEAAHVFVFAIMFVPTRRGPTSYGIMRRHSEEMAYLFHERPPADKYLDALEEARIVAHEFYVRSGCLAHCG